MSKFKGPGKWKADAPGRANTGSSIRGKISAPIPIDDDEFPIRSPGTGIATPLGTDGNDKQLSMPVRTSTASGRPGSSLTRDRSATLSSARPSYEAPVGSMRRTNQPGNLRNSMISTLESNGVKPPQRKKSSLRSALGKLFGKKRKSTASDANATVNGTRANELRNGQHRSAPNALRSPQNSTFSTKRSASLPINEFNRALRSHSPGPGDSFPLHNSENGRNSDSIQTDGYTRPRRVTTPSRLYTPTKTPGYVDWTGLSPRPASSHARGSKVISDEDADAIGYAVTKGSHPNRRSRSHGHLRDAPLSQNASRRRSDEIRYWRQSYDPGALSPMSSNKPEAEEPLMLDQPEIPQPSEPQEPPQPFNFGPMGEMAGMKITQAAGLETRVSRLEARVLQVEKSLCQIQHRTQGGHLHLQDPPKRNSRKDPSTMSVVEGTQNSLPKDQPRQLQGSTVCGSQGQSSTYSSSRPSTTSTSNSYQPSYHEASSPPSFLTSAPNTASQDATRPLSTSTTIRGYPSSSPTQAKGGYLTMEHYTALTNMILAEQAARRNLEVMVYDLQQQLQAKRSRRAVAYPNPRSEHAADPLAPGEVTGGEFSSFEQDDSSDEEGRYGNENFMTPREDQGHFGDEVFGVSAMGNGGEVKGGPRTLSLSQMTMRSANGGTQPSLNF